MDISPTMMLHRGIGRKIRERRKERNLRQAELAVAIHCSRATLVNVESGRQQPTLDLLYKLSSQLHCSYIDLLPTEEEIEKMKTEAGSAIMTPEKEKSIISDLKAKAKEREVN
ncbi:MAG: helix-turn-helix transcriptional regulator [Patescibacteria group bacterium]